MDYNNISEKDLEEIINKTLLNNKKEREIIVYGGRGGDMFRQALDNYVNGMLRDFKYKFKSKSGKVIEIDYEKYNNLKQETKDKLEPYRINDL